MTVAPDPSGPRARRSIRSRALPGLALLALLLSGCTYHMENFQGATKQGHLIYRLFQGFDIVALAVGVFVWALIFWCILAYRRRHRDHWPPQTHHNLPWEFAYTTIPILIVCVLFGYTYVAENSVNKVAANPDNVMTITAFQWGWKFDYNTAGAGRAEIISDPNHYGTFELPVNQVTRINLVTADVVHQFYVAQFNFGRYAQSGVTNTFDLTPTRTGTFIGRCAQFCGLHHDLMIFYVKVVQPAEFQTWLQQLERPPT